MRFLRTILAILARVAISLVFLVSGIDQIIFWKETEKRLMNTIADWQIFTASSEGWRAVFSTLAVWSPVLLMAATFLQMLGALLLLFGMKERMGAVLLIVVLVPTTLLVQHFWFAEASQRESQLAFFLRDLAILGGLLVVVLRGTRDLEDGETFR